MSSCQTIHTRLSRRTPFNDTGFDCRVQHCDDCYGVFTVKHLGCLNDSDLRGLDTFRMSEHAHRLADRLPTLTPQEMVNHLVPPPHFAHASFESYQPDPAYESQQLARDTLRSFATGAQIPSSAQRSSGGIFSRTKKKQLVEPTTVRPGVYLDGGFGVGKTHLLAALWHASVGRKYFGTFIEYTALVGALGYQAALETLRGASLICIDEFELDDPGDTMIMTRLIGELAASGCRFAATSNTPPNALGEGRFAAADFLREIQAIGDKFTTLRIDGEDYRHRDVSGHAIALTEAQFKFALADTVLSGDRVTSDTFADLLAHLAKVHPSAYIQLIDGIGGIGITDAYTLESQTDALRFVAFIDRVYDAQIPVYATGVPLDQVFAEDMLQGGYRKKYLRCMSRLVALTSGEL